MTALSHAACHGSVKNYRIEKSMDPENSHCHAFEPRQSIHRTPQSINTTVQNKGSAKWHQDFAFSLHSTCCAKKIQNISTRLVSAKTPEAQGCKRQPQTHPNTAPGCRMPHAHAPSKHSHRSRAQDAPSSLPAMTSKAVTSICCLNKRQKPWQLRSCFKNPLACSVGLTQKTWPSSVQCCTLT